MDALLNRKFHALLAKLRMDADDKKSLVKHYTNGRTTSSKDMSDFEAKEVLRHLESVNRSLYPALQAQDFQRHADTTKTSCDKLRKVLIAKSYTIGENVAFVKGWCEKYGIFGIKKCFNNYNAQELKGLIEKFNKVYTHRINKVGGSL